MTASVDWTRRLEAAAALAVERLADVAFVDAEAPRGGVVRSPIDAAPAGGSEAARVSAALSTGAADVARWQGWERRCTSLDDDPRPPGLPNDAGGAWMTVPLSAAGETRGALTVWLASGAIAPSTIAEVELLAAVVTLALEDARALAAANEARAEAEAFADAAEAALREEAHELRTPISSALLWLGVLRAGTPSKTSPLEAVEQCVKQLQAIVDRPKPGRPRPRGSEPRLRRSSK